MPILVELYIIVVALFWSIITTVAGLLFIPIILLMAAIGYPKNYTVTSSNESLPLEDNTSPPLPDLPTPESVEPKTHHLHVTIDYVPQEYYTAYSKYLKSQEWRALRRLVLKRDKYTCVDCSVRGYNQDYNPDGPFLQVHHLHYDGIETMTFTIEQCVSLCPTCHDKRHRRH